MATPWITIAVRIHLSTYTVGTHVTAAKNTLVNTHQNHGGEFVHDSVR